MPAISQPKNAAGKALLDAFVGYDKILIALATLQSDLGGLAARVSVSQGAAGDKTQLSLEYVEIGKRLPLLKSPVDVFVVAQQAWLAR